ncbi:unnamed protein product, partial [Musa acuminata var. zebrina]
RSRGRWPGSSCEDGGHHASVSEILVRVGGGRAISDSGTGSSDTGGEFHSKRIWNTFLVALCAAYCVSFTFTNSYRAATGAALLRRGDAQGDMGVQRAAQRPAGTRHVPPHLVGPLPRVAVAGGVPHDSAAS